MDTNPLFTMALGLTEPWEVVETKFDGKQLNLRIAYRDSSHFDCPCCGASHCPVHDAKEKRWRHMDFFQHEAYIIARVPRVRCAKCGVKQVTVPWSRPGSGFTLFMEAMILEMVKHAPVRSVARTLRVNDKRLWRVMGHYVDEAVDQQDLSKVRRIGIDETSVRKRHDYITLFFDLDERRLIFGTSGKGADVLQSFVAHLEQHHGNAEQIKEVSCDMSPAFIKGISNELPKANITFDRFHVSKILNEAVDKIRRVEWRKDRTLKGCRYLMLRNPQSLSDAQATRLNEVMRRNATLSEAYKLKETFRDLYVQDNWRSGRGFLRGWITAVTKSNVRPLIKAAATIQRHWVGILRWHVTKISNGVMEGLNSLVQAAKRKARGYATHRTFIWMAYLIAGKFDLVTHTK